MINATLALLLRSLRQDTKYFRPHLIRAVCGLMIYGSLIIAQLQSIQAGAPGLRFFRSITTLNLYFLTLAGISFFATAITEEKEEETLPLLQMANISGLSILLGKSTSRVISVFLMLSIQFPFTVLAVTLGGCTLHQVWATFWAVVAYMILLANIALFGSVLMRRSRQAASFVTLMVVAIYIIPAIFDSSGVTPGGTGAVIFDYYRDVSIFYRVGTILETGFNESVISLQVMCNVGIGGVFFILSWAWFSLFSERRQQGTERPALMGTAARMKWLKPSRAWALALAWKDYNFLTGGYVGTAIKFVLFGLVVLATYLIVGMQAGQPEWAIISTWIMFGMVVVQGLRYSGVVFQHEIKQQTLSALVMLPQYPIVIVYSKFLGCAMGLAPALFWMMVSLCCTPQLALEVVTFPATWLIVGELIIMMSLAVQLSMHMKWGAVAASFAIVLMFFNCCPIFTLITFAFGQGELQSILGLIIALIILTMFLVPMHWLLSETVKKVASR